MRSPVRDGYREVNRAGWQRLAARGVESSQPVSRNDLAYAHAWLDPDDWLPWARIATVLCLAAGGGQQGPLFASLGRHVTVLDLSAAQLERDRATAAVHGLAIETVQGDMLDLGALRPRRFDLVWQAVSSLYVPDVRRLYREVASVLEPGGLYRVEHCEPAAMQLAPRRPWDGRAYRLARPAMPKRDVWSDHAGGVLWQYRHSLEDLLGGLCDAGFAIVRVAERSAPTLGDEPGSYEHVSRYLPSFISVLARYEAGRRP
jgi:SAM-dependent methyltransferase